MWDNDQKRKVLDLLLHTDPKATDWQIPVLESIVSPYHRGYITRQFEVLSEDCMPLDVKQLLYIFVEGLKTTDEVYSGF